MTTPKQITIGTRGSQLATWQTNHIAHLLQTNWPTLTCHIQQFVTKGDKTLNQPLPQIGGKGLFTAELEEALRQGEIDLAVHSLKDLPVEEPTGLCIGAIVGRADVRDVLITATQHQLETLPAGAKIGTSSLRRQAQLLAARPDLNVQSIRGNVDTRIKKVLSGEYDAIVLAAAGVTRIGLEQHISQWLPLSLMWPAPGQGALAVQCRADDQLVHTLLKAIDNVTVRHCVTAERAFLSGLGGGCSIPVAAYAYQKEENYHLTGLVATPNGRKRIQVQAEGNTPLLLGQTLAQQAIKQGAEAILAHV